MIREIVLKVLKAQGVENPSEEVIDNAIREHLEQKVILDSGFLDLECFFEKLKHYSRYLLEVHLMANWYLETRWSPSIIKTLPS